VIEGLQRATTTIPIVGLSLGCLSRCPNLATRREFSDERPYRNPENAFLGTVGGAI